MNVAVANLAADTGKTTSALHIAAGLAQDGPTLLVDADPRGAARSWARALGCDAFEVVSMASPDLHRLLPAVAAGMAHVVIDAPTGDPVVTRSAMLAAGRLVVPTPASAAALGRVDDTLDLAAAAGRAADVLLVRLTAARGGWERDDVARLLGDPPGVRVMADAIPLLERSGMSMGMSGPAHAYRPVVDDLLSHDALRAALAALVGPAAT